MRDEEVMLPGTYEYAERMAARPEVKFHWVYASQPVLNVFNRANPYFWPFDPEVPEEKWVRRPPAIAYKIPEHNIEAMCGIDRFPPPEGKKLFVVLGLRVSESTQRRAGLHSSGGYRTIHPAKSGYYKVRPIYDWEDTDVWKFISDFKTDYNTAYDVMYRHGVPAAKMRIAPPTMNHHAIAQLAMARKAWPGGRPARGDEDRRPVRPAVRATKPSTGRDVERMLSADMHRRGPGRVDCQAGGLRYRKDPEAACSTRHDAVPSSHAVLGM